MPIDAIRTAFTGMKAATRRLEAAASNVANASSTGRVPDAAGRTNAYRPVTVRQQATDGGVTTDLVPRTPAFELQYAPDDPDADAKGMIAAPAVDLATEMVDTLQARTSYAASATVMKVASDMERKAINLIA